MAAITPSLDHLVYEELIKLVLGQTGAVAPLQRTACRTGIDTIITAIQAQDPLFDVPNREDRKVLALA